MENNDGLTSLQMACSNLGNEGVLQLLIQSGGKELLMKQCTDLCAALHYAVSSENPNPKIVKMLIESGGKDLVMRSDTDGFTALHSICGDGQVNYDIVKLLIDCGGQELLLKKSLENANTALHDICTNEENKNYDVIKLLIQSGGKKLVLQQDSSGGTCLHDVCENEMDDIEVIKMMVQAGGKDLIQIRNKKGDCATTVGSKFKDFLLAALSAESAEEKIGRALKKRKESNGNEVIASKKSK